ncbi:sterol-sensing domain of SREBP cleavage-activation-domain-containing protein [Tricharina praecox]|uniref:sterol-sensing domain of SREBP cleavage-activation-domain-containing protein n=1 Tax=Tricharina praecox TaxID=43433 RepID=UPI002220D507|nr:sterol-sensing domain of SREBP cleavage-activation-domain-containing protein [Tricharina praecox]KAI5840369.1 sterol-sensing domain of SREBP cleavage-activation-domain-containing protein [Tricharina praecox]
MELPLRSSAQITLRWASVFAGKHFSHQKLIAADALVISMFYHLNSTAGEEWDRRAAKLIREVKDHGRYRVYGQDFQSTFRILGRVFAPVEAVKSRIGLVITALTQVWLVLRIPPNIPVSDGSASDLHIDHVELHNSGDAQSPGFTCSREVFPFIVIVIGLENMFRLINAVLATPAEQPSTKRISSALGEVGFLSFVAVATDVGFLSLIAVISVPAVREFCAFAGIALIMDFVGHNTFFLAVLSVDVQRMELQDSLDRLMSLNSNEDNNDFQGLDKTDRNPSPVADFLFRGGSPLSTRIAGSAIMICFAVALNIHFLDNQHPLVSLMMFIDMLRHPNRFSQCNVTHDMPLNVARTPTAWLSKQDEYTGMELIRAAKHMRAAMPDAFRIIAKAYSPIFFELAGSDRAQTPDKMPNIISTIDIDVLKEHWELPEEAVVPKENEGSLLKCRTLIEGHSLDVAVLAASPRGILVSVGLDRRIVVWKLKGNQQPCLKDVIRPTCAEHVLWPIIGVALDEKGEWLAIAPKCGKVSFYQVEKSTLYRSLDVDLQGHQPSAFFFAPRNLNDEQNHGPRLVVLRSDGCLFEVYVKTKEIVRHQICEGVVVSSSHGVFTPRLPLRIVTACQRGRIFVTAKSQGDWYTEQLDLMSPPFTSPSMEPGEPCTILPLSSLGMVISSRSCNVELVDILSGGIIRSFQTGQFKPGSLRAFHAKQRTCLYCGCPSVLSFSIAYSERESGMFMMHTFTSSRGKMRDICLRAERDRRERKCTGFESVIETTHWLDNVEGWEPTSLNMVAGVRRREVPLDDQSSDDYESPTHCGSSLRRRKQLEKKNLRCDDEEDEWEAWTMDSCGVVTSYPLHDSTDPDSRGDGLLVSRAGPVTKLGQRSVAVGFGNNIKLLLLGMERYEDEDGGDPYHDIARRPRGIGCDEGIEHGY